MTNVIDFTPVAKDTSTPRPPRTEEEKKALRKMIENVVSSWTYPSDEAISATLEQTKRYVTHVVNVLRIHHNNIPAEFVTSTEEMYEDITEHFEALQQYSNTPASIGFSKDDYEIWTRILLTHRWLMQYDFRTLQDPQIYNAIQSFRENIWPLIISKLGNKLWILDDVAEWSSLEERVLYELEREMKINKRATS